MGQPLPAPLRPTGAKFGELSHRRRRRRERLSLLAGPPRRPWPRRRGRGYRSVQLIGDRARRNPAPVARRHAWKRRVSRAERGVEDSGG